MKNQLPITAWSIKGLKRRAGDIRTVQGVPKHQALETIAQLAGYPNWKILKKSKVDKLQKLAIQGNQDHKLSFRSLFNLNNEEFWAGDEFDLRSSHTIPAIVSQNYPKELGPLSFLKPWKALWLKDTSYYAQDCFIPPMIPLECFEGSNKYYRLIQNWPQQTRPSGCFYCGAIIYNGNDEMVGVVHYYIWGTRNKYRSVEFSCCIKQKDELIRFWFDLRQIYSDVQGQLNLKSCKWEDRADEPIFKNTLKSLYRCPFHEVDEDLAEHLGW